MDIRPIDYVILGIVGGICICKEGSLNSLLERHVGVLRATLAPFGTGFLAIRVNLFFVTGEKVGVRGLSDLFERILRKGGI